MKADGMSQRKIGDVLGLDHRTVGRDLRSGENSPRTEEKFEENSSDIEDKENNFEENSSRTFSETEKERRKELSEQERRSSLVSSIGVNFYSPLV
jgi:hypothetical protein